MDQLDEAQVLEERERNAGIARAGAQLIGEGAACCESCGDEIEPGRRKAMPSAIRCISCQDRRERWHRKKGKR